MGGIPTDRPGVMTSCTGAHRSRILRDTCPFSRHLPETFNLSADFPQQRDRKVIDQNKSRAPKSKFIGVQRTLWGDPLEAV
jgi:hypothetical protein